mmetsp:Transcript_28404/g.91566  ORF Transcript_28404/g.91566 Transcript_28404/m.91566 type:complete len:139 (+) Transcript_28404:64-480(+)
MATPPKEISGSCHCGAVRWTYKHSGEKPLRATACNCTVCRRYGVLWIYGHVGEEVELLGQTTAYVRGTSLDFHFCPACGCVAAWRSLTAKDDGRRMMAVNVRLAEPDDVAALPIRHFDGLDTFHDRPQDGRCVKDMWF